MPLTNTLCTKATLQVKATHPKTTERKDNRYRQGILIQCITNKGYGKQPEN